MLYYFKGRKPSLLYVKEWVEVQFYIENKSEHIKKSFTLEDGTVEERVVRYAYDKYGLVWREEFSQKAEYDENREIIKQDYITENYEVLLAEAKQI